MGRFSFTHFHHGLKVNCCPWLTSSSPFRNLHKLYLLNFSLGLQSQTESSSNQANLELRELFTLSILNRIEAATPRDTPESGAFNPLLLPSRALLNTRRKKEVSSHVYSDQDRVWDIPFEYPLSSYSSGATCVPDTSTPRNSRKGCWQE